MYIHLLDTTGLLFFSIVQHRAMLFELPPHEPLPAPASKHMLQQALELVQVFLFHISGYIVVFGAFCVAASERSLIGCVYFLAALILLFR